VTPVVGLAGALQGLAVAADQVHVLVVVELGPEQLLPRAGDRRRMAQQEDKAGVGPALGVFSTIIRLPLPDSSRCSRRSHSRYSRVPASRPICFIERFDHVLSSVTET
jgi:hypothetical protein